MICQTPTQAWHKQMFTRREDVAVLRLIITRGDLHIRVVSPMCGKNRGYRTGTLKATWIQVYHQKGIFLDIWSNKGAIIRKSSPRENDGVFGYLGSFNNYVTQN